MLFAKRSFRVSPRLLASDLSTRARTVDITDLGAARFLVVYAGQLEQGLADAALASSSHITGLSADLFVAALLRTSPAPSTKHQLIAEIANLASRLGGDDVKIRIPEGFAWYALYPDNYAKAALDWAARHRQRSDRILVVGIRSIGTTLAAVICAALRHAGFATGAASVRPEGDPFDRNTTAPAGCKYADRVIIADEGPGLSGSSFACVARAIESEGVEGGRIDFFTGHENGPGPMLTEANRAWWSKHRVWCSPGVGSHILHDVRETATMLLDEALSVLSTSYNGDAGDNEFERAAAPPLATPKLLAIGTSGRRIVFRFAGIALTAPPTSLGTLHLRRATRTASRGFGGMPLGARHGWIAEPWIEGHKLGPSDASPDVLSSLASYFTPDAPDRITRGRRVESTRKIAEALEFWTGQHGMGKPRLIRAASERMSCEAGKSAAAFDGRTAPHKWRKSGTGGLLKVDTVGHSCDHTWVGEQSIWWDVAGTEIEWELGPALQRSLRDMVSASTGETADPARMAFYRAGYCAFRSAVARHCAMVCQPADAYTTASSWYDRCIEQELAELYANLV